MSRRTSFQFGTRLVVAFGAPVGFTHPNVFRLSIQTSLVARFIRSLYHALPSALSSFFKAWFPEWTLPDRIILKKEKPDWDEEFITESQTYNKLQSLQGYLIPIFYGQVNHDNARAIVLSDIGGADMSTPEGALLANGQILRAEDFETLLYQSFNTMAACGIVHDDIKLDNFRRVDRSNGEMVIMAVDLERVDEVQSPENGELMKRSAVNMLVSIYRNHVKCMRYDGLLPKEE